MRDSQYYLLERYLVRDMTGMLIHLQMESYCVMKTQLVYIYILTSYYSSTIYTIITSKSTSHTSHIFIV